MINLIKVEFTRLFKSKFFVVSFVLCLILSFLAGLIVFVDRDSRNDLSSLEAALESINITSNSGLIACIVMVAFISTDIKDGTIRNKMIAGYSREKILISYFVVTFCYILFMLLTSFVILFILYTIAYTPNLVYYSVPYLFDTILFGLISVAYMTTICVFLACVFNGRVLPIVLLLAFVFGLSIIGAFTDLISRSDRFENVEKLFNFLTNINYYYCCAYIGTFDIVSGGIIVKETYSSTQVLVYTLIPVLYSLANFAGIWLIFRRRDFK